MIEQWILVVNSLSVITAIFLINFNETTSGRSPDVWVDVEFGEMSSSWQGRARLGCWYSTRVFLIHICNVEQCSKLFRQGSSRLLSGGNLAYHDNFIITAGPLPLLASFTDQVVCPHRVSVILTTFTRQPDLETSGRGGLFKCWTAWTREYCCLYQPTAT